MNGIKRTLLLSSLFCVTGCRQSTNEPSRTILEGTWGSACLPVAIAGTSTSSSRILYIFNDDHRVVRSLMGFGDASCQDPASNLSHEGIYSLGVRTEVSLFNVDMIFTAVSATPKTEATVALWNTTGFCGQSHWALDESLSILGQGGDACLSFGVSTIEYRDVVEVHSYESLVFGGTLNHLVPRPSAAEPFIADHVFSLISP